MLPNFYVYTAVPLTDTNILVGTSYGPLFLDEDDFSKFDFDPNWLIDNIDSPAVHELLSDIKIHYMELAAKLRLEGDLS